VVRKQVLLEPKQVDALMRLAERTGQSMSAPVREAIDVAPARAEDADARWEALLQRWWAMPAAGAHGTRRREAICDHRLARYDDAAC
jgi:hypothetical protein